MSAAQEAEIARLKAEVARMRGVCEAAKGWSVGRNSFSIIVAEKANLALLAAIDALEGEGREKEDATHASLD